MRPSETLRCLKFADHRPWPLPAREWAWRQSWHDLLFMAWPVPASALRALVPSALNPHKFDGTAWIALMAFWMSGLRHRRLPLPQKIQIPALSLHTFVIRNGRPGVWFLRFGGGNRLGAWLAHHGTGLPVAPAAIQVDRSVARICHRTELNNGAVFEAHYSPEGGAAYAVPGTLAHWLTERYAIYSRNGAGGLRCGEIHHMRWPLQEASVTVRRNDLLDPTGLNSHGPLGGVWYTPRVELVGWPALPVPALGQLAGARFNRPAIPARQGASGPVPETLPPAGHPVPAGSAAVIS